MMKKLLSVWIIILLVVNAAAQSPAVYFPGGSCGIYNNGAFTVYSSGLRFNYFDAGLSFEVQKAWAGYNVSNASADLNRVEFVHENGTDYLIWSGSTSVFDTISPGGNNQAVVMKTAVNGDTIWTHVYDDYSGLIGGVMTLADDGNYVFGMWGGKGDVVKVDSQNGDTLWTNKNVYSSSGYDLRTTINAMAVNTGDAYYFSGEVYPISNANFMLMKTDTLGNALWVKAYGDTTANLCWGGAQTHDGGFIMVGQSAPNDFTVDTLWYHDFLVVRTDSNGDTLWCKRYDNNLQVDKAYSVMETSDFGFAILGTTQSWTPLPGGNGVDVHTTTLLLKTDSLGNPIWATTYDPGQINNIYRTSAIRPTTMDGFYWTDLLLQVTDSSGINCMAQTASVTVEPAAINIINVPTYTEKGIDISSREHPHTVNPFGSVIDYCTFLGVEIPVLSTVDFSIFPNPVQSLLNIRSDHLSSTAPYSIFNLYGEKVQSGNLNNYQTDVSVLPPGMFIFYVNTGTGTGYQKFIKQ
ncbi:MAG TPA: T9SS type A sorting domain-containing protein [Bacteroidia bacterium]|nr:T9SS type A sorting domain-containing protein [Bacteroidia bacterium]